MDEAHSGEVVLSSGTGSCHAEELGGNHLELRPFTSIHQPVLQWDLWTFQQDLVVKWLLLILLLGFSDEQLGVLHVQTHMLGVIGVLQGGFFVFCKLGWGEADVLIAFRGQYYYWLVVVKSLFENQRDIDIVEVNKRSFTVHITQRPLGKCLRMVKMKLNLKKNSNFSSPGKSRVFS